MRMMFYKVFSLRIWAQTHQEIPIDCRELKLNKRGKGCLKVGLGLDFILIYVELICRSWALYFSDLFWYF